MTSLYTFPSKSIASWSPREWDLYAQQWLSLYRIEDAAAVIRLGDLLRVHAVRCGGDDPDALTPAEIASAVSTAMEADDEIDAAELKRTVPKRGGPPWLQRVAMALWRHGGLPALESLHYPAVPEVVIDDLACILAGQTKVQAATGNLILGDRIVAQMIGSEAPVSDAHSALGTPAAHRVVRFVVAQAWLRALRREQLADEIHVPGGWRGLAQRLGLMSRSAAQDLQRAGEALSTLSLQTPLGLQPVLRAEVTRIHGDVTLMLTAQGPLAVGFVNALGVAKKTHRLLVPLRPDLPVLTNHRLSHAQQLSFEMLILKECRLRAGALTGDEISVLPGFYQPDLAMKLPASVIAACAAAVGLSPKNRDAVLNLWHAPSAKGGWLELTILADTYVLHGPVVLMNRFINVGLQMSEAGRARQRRRRRRKAAKP